MTIHNNFRTGAILTQGLGLAAGDALVTTQFHLIRDFEIVVEPPPVQPEGGGGGTGVMGTGGVQPYTPGQYGKSVLPNWKGPAYKVTFRVKTKSTQKETVYYVPMNRAMIIVRALNFVNKTKEAIGVTAGKLKKGWHSARVWVRNLRKK